MPSQLRAFGGCNLPDSHVLIGTPAFRSQFSPPGHPYSIPGSATESELWTDEKNWWYNNVVTFLMLSMLPFMVVTVVDSGHSNCDDQVDASNNDDFSAAHTLQHESSDDRRRHVPCLRIYWGKEILIRRS